MSEIKPDVEYVIKTGRQVVERKQVDFPNKLNSQIDAVKQQYNELGAQVTRTKCDLEKALKISKRLRKELNGFQEFIQRSEEEMSDRELASAESTVSEELAWITDVRADISQRRQVLGALHELAAHLNKLCEEASLSESPEANITRAGDSLNELDEKLKARSDYLQTLSVAIGQKLTNQVPDHSHVMKNESDFEKWLDEF